MPASRNHSSSETTVEQKINVSDNSSGANFPNSLMSVNNIYNFDSHPVPKNTILIAGDSMINGINVLTNIYFNLIPLLRTKPAPLVLHVSTNNSSNETSFQIYDKLLNLVHSIKENNSNCQVVLSSPIDRLDDGKAALTIKS